MASYVGIKWRRANLDRASTLYVEDPTLYMELKGMQLYLPSYQVFGAVAEEDDQERSPDGGCALITGSSIKQQERITFHCPSLIKCLRG
ncbi:hypothetical protein PIB30_070634 [Stylosanthes scabra]|uniref:Uncharacterized protein n=1 Tax=Stylosanthes scabra TaxID=79078 RepID=A0ABU6VNJ5_9FABA|nr:hypothetical protein [Stylosanthes scabra]